MATEVFLVKCSRGGIYAKFWSQEIWQRWWNIFPSTRVLSFDQLISSLVGFDLDLDLSDLCDLTASDVVQLFCQSGLLIFLSSPWHIGPGPGSLTYWTWLQFLTLAWIDELIWPLIMLLTFINCEFWPKKLKKRKSVTRGKCPLMPINSSAWFRPRGFNKVMPLLFSDKLRSRYCQLLLFLCTVCFLPLDSWLTYFAAPTLIIEYWNIFQCPLLQCPNVFTRSFFYGMCQNSDYKRHSLTAVLLHYKPSKIQFQAGMQLLNQTELCNCV